MKIRGYTVSILLSATLAHASTMQAPSDVPGLTEQDHIDLGAQYASVGELDGAFSGSGVLIAPNWVLTAAHVADYSDNDEMTFTIGGQVYQSAEVILHPDYVTFASDHANDLALVRLDTAVGDIGPAKLWRFGQATDVMGLETSWVGYGQGGTGLTGAKGIYQKRGFTNVIDYTGADIGVTPDAMVTDFDRIDGSENADERSDPTPSPLEGNVTPLDSGGGVFAEFGELDYLIGVISFGGALDGVIDSDYGDLSGAINLHNYLGWIETTSGVVAVPEPGHFALLAGLAMLAVGMAARRRKPI